MTAVRGFFVFLVALVATVSSAADQEWYGIYMQGGKIGYASAMEQPITGDPSGASIRATSETVLRSALLSTDLDIRIVTESLLDSKRNLVSMRYETISNGRSQVMTAKFTKDQIRVRIENGGSVSNTVLPIPAGRRVVDDPMTTIEFSGTMKAYSLLVLDPTSGTLIENSIACKGKLQTDIKGISTQAYLVEITDPRSVTKVFFSEKGDLLKIEAAMGMLMFPEPKEVAMDLTHGVRVDLASSTSIKVTPPIANPTDSTEVKFRCTGVDLSSLPTGSNQTIVKSGDGFVVTIKPEGSTPATREAIAKQAIPIGSLASTMPEWLKPGLHVPCDEAKFKELAASIIGRERNPVKAADLIAKWVNDQMTPNAAIGVLRNANEILKSKEGVCRDYSILSATLLRAAGIPTRVISGMIYEDGQFYYHAWDEIWTGRTWLPVDSTRAYMPFDATHWKIGQGSVETAFTFKVLDGAKVELISVSHR